MNLQRNYMESTTNQIEYTYKLFRGADSHLYVSVGPLMSDIKKSIETMADMDITELSEQNKQVFDLKILGLRTIYEFLGALEQEQYLKEKKTELNGDVPLNTDSNFTLTGASPTKVH